MQIPAEWDVVDSLAREGGLVSATVLELAGDTGRGAPEVRRALAWAAERGFVHEREPRIWVATDAGKAWVEQGPPTATPAMETAMTTRTKTGESRRQILAALEAEPGLSGTEYAERLGWSRGRAGSALNRLKRAGKVRKVGERQFSRWFAADANVVELKPEPRKPAPTPAQPGPDVHATLDRLRIPAGDLAWRLGWLECWIGHLTDGEGAA